MLIKPRKRLLFGCFIRALARRRVMYQAAASMNHWQDAIAVATRKGVVMAWGRKRWPG